MSTGAVSGDTLCQVNYGILTVNQIDMFLKAMPFELTYADDNNQFSMRFHRIQTPCLLNVPPQSGSRMSTVHGSLPPAHYEENVEWVIGTLRNAEPRIRSRSFQVLLQVSSTLTCSFKRCTLSTMDRHAGINQIVFNFQPWLDWYLRDWAALVSGSGPFAPCCWRSWRRRC